MMKPLHMHTPEVSFLFYFYFYLLSVTNQTVPLWFPCWYALGFMNMNVSTCQVQNRQGVDIHFRTTMEICLWLFLCFILHCFNQTQYSVCAYTGLLTMKTGSTGAAVLPVYLLFFQNFAIRASHTTHIDWVLFFNDLTGSVCAQWPVVLVQRPNTVYAWGT